MIPYRFGPEEGQLHGVYYPPAGTAIKRTGVLLCAPFGPEATRSHRIYRVFAERLARAGFAVLGFDYLGTGDSDGDFSNATLAAWRADIARAHLELLARSGLRAGAWVGLRLGAALALQTAAGGLTRPARIVGWDPVVEGRAYLDEMREANLAFLKRDFGLGWAAVEARIAAASPVDDEVLGFPLGDELRAELAALDLAASELPPVETVIVATARSPALSRLQEAMPEALWRQVRSSSPWNSDEAMNASIVPGDVLDAVHAALEDLP